MLLCCLGGEDLNGGRGGYYYCSVVTLGPVIYHTEHFVVSKIGLD